MGWWDFLLFFLLLAICSLLHSASLPHLHCCYWYHYSCDEIQLSFQKTSCMWDHSVVLDVDFWLSAMQTCHRRHTNWQMSRLQSNSLWHEQNDWGSKKKDESIWYNFSSYHDYRWQHQSSGYSRFSLDMRGRPVSKAKKRISSKALNQLWTWCFLAAISGNIIRDVSVTKLEKENFPDAKRIKKIAVGYEIMRSIVLPLMEALDMFYACWWRIFFIPILWLFRVWK